MTSSSGLIDIQSKYRNGINECRKGQGESAKRRQENTMQGSEDSPILQANGEGAMEIESLCPRCEKNGKTRLLMLDIPHFREVVLMVSNTGVV